MSGLSTKSIHELCAMLGDGACSSREIVSDLAQTIRRTDGTIQGYLWFDEEDALAQANAADAARESGSTARLLGIPIAVKDVLNVKGQPCTCASRILEGYTSLYDSTAIARLREAGAVFAGRTNMDEFAMGSSTENSAVQVTRNPWNLDRVPGGSSGGSAAVVAANEACAALGTDTGGSIRQPAAFCGCVGLKPSYGRISRYGLTAYASSLDQIGPLTRTVRDAALLLEVIAGHDPMDSTSVEVGVPVYTQNLDTDLSSVTIGLPREYFVEGTDPEVEQAVRAAVSHCESLGAQVVEISLPHTEYVVSTYYVIATAEASANLARFDGVRYGHRAAEAEDLVDMYGQTRAAGFGEEVKRRIILGTYVLSSGYYDAYYLAAQKARTLIRRDFENAFERCDVIMGPVAPSAAYPLGAVIDDPLKMYLGDVLTATVNLAGNCAISVPCGFTGDGLPVGLQIIGPAYQEERILSAAHAFEQNTEWHKAQPTVTP